MQTNHKSHVLSVLTDVSDAMTHVQQWIHDHPRGRLHLKPSTLRLIDTAGVMISKDLDYYIENLYKMDKAILCSFSRSGFLAVVESFQLGMEKRLKDLTPEGRDNEALAVFASVISYIDYINTVFLDRVSDVREDDRLRIYKNFKTTSKKLTRIFQDVRKKNVGAYRILERLEAINTKFFGGSDLEGVVTLHKSFTVKMPHCSNWLLLEDLLSMMSVYEPKNVLDLVRRVDAYTRRVFQLTPR